MRELVIQSLRNISANKLRSSLSMFGIAWGITSIMILSAVSEGFQQGNDRVFAEFGKNLVIVRNGRTSLQAGGERAGRTIRLDIEDVYTLKRESQLLEFISPELMQAAVAVKSRHNSGTLQMSGIWPVFQSIRTIEAERGRLLNHADCNQARRVAVIGFDAAKQLFADRDPIGSQITLGGVPYTIVGKVRKKDQASNYTGPDNGRLFLPYETMRQDFPLSGRFETTSSLSAIVATPYEHVTRQLEQLGDDEGKSIFNSTGPVETEIRAILSRTRGFDPLDTEALVIWNTAILSAMFVKMMRAMSEFFIAVSVVTLVLGGIGVMNIMFIAVKERTLEIGLRKAVGATSKSIQWLFASESFFLTLTSGAIGLAFGAVLCILVNRLPLPARFAGMIVTWPAGLLAAAALTLIGVGASILPARRAAALPPVEALRCEQ